MTFKDKKHYLIKGYSSSAAEGLADLLDRRSKDNHFLTGTGREAVGGVSNMVSDHNTDNW